MNRNQRRYRPQLPKRAGSERDIKIKCSRLKCDVEGDDSAPTEPVVPVPKKSVPTVSRASNANPVCLDFGQWTHTTDDSDQYQILLREQYGFDPNQPDPTDQIKELRKVLQVPTVDNSSQYVNPDTVAATPTFVETSDGSQWQNVDNVDDIDKFLGRQKDRCQGVCNGCNTCCNVGVPVKAAPENIRVSKVPRVKVIAEKFCRFKKNNIELRRLVEKIVCIEYDIFDQDVEGKENLVQPVQQMRAYFSVKPSEVGKDGENAATFNEIPSSIKRKFNIANEDLKKLTDKEIEIIDEKIEENKPYLEDLAKVYKRKQSIVAKKNKTSLDLMSLYQMAKRESQAMDHESSHANLLSKAELEEVKKLILTNSVSSAHGISRRTLKSNKSTKLNKSNSAVVSQNTFMDLLKDK